MNEQELIAAKKEIIRHMVQDFQSEIETMVKDYHAKQESVLEAQSASDIENIRQTISGQ